MPIKIPNDLPAAKALESENIFVMTETRGLTQDIRPLEVLLLNLMPTKIKTETQLARLVGNTPLQVNLTLMQVRNHKAKNTSEEHMISFYKTFDEVCNKKFDGMIITGAPVENLEFEDVDYWEELCDIMEWTKTHVTSTFHLCWAAQAALYYHYGVSKIPFTQKLHGVYEHVIDYPSHMLFRGVDDIFLMPHSRNAGNNRGDIEAVKEIKILASSDKTGVAAAITNKGKQVFIMGHPEYDTETLGDEYTRDLKAGLNPSIPVNYYEEDNPNAPVVNKWRAHANLIYSNWLNYFVYQTTPYDIEAIS